MLDKLRSLLGFGNKSTDSTSARETVDIQQIVQSIRKQEQQDIATGRKLLRIDYQQFDLLVDREFTGRYRISVFQGQHKVYGFTINEKEIDNQQFEAAWDDILIFLEQPSPTQLPQSDLLTTHFFGHPK